MYLERVWLYGNYIEFYVYQSDIEEMPIRRAIVTGKQIGRAHV